jgi:hypothetical protein
MQKQKSALHFVYFLQGHLHVGIFLVLTVSCTIAVYSITIYHVMAQPDSGQYSNPTYGITSFEISVAVAEGMFGDKGISISMHPGTSDELLQGLAQVKLMRPYQ